MANKLILTQIMKNESHVANRMLDSIKGFVDGICIIDTGSTDDSINIVKKWGEDNGIETYVFERPFDNFEASRNFSIEKARETFLGRNDGNKYYAFWIDFDEQMVLQPGFNKQNIDKDFYMFNVFIGKMKYTRNELFLLEKPFRWYGVVHEFLVCDEQNITSGLMEGLHVSVSMDGSSWQGKTSEKYLEHSHVLEKYISGNRQDPRWIFYTAQSYHDSASIPDNREENEERLRRSFKYYKERASRPDGYAEEIFYSNYRMGTIMNSMEETWSKTMEQCLKAYSIDPLRGEPVKVIIDHYLKMSEWNNAYLYAKFAFDTYHGKNPYPNRLLFIDESLYKWKFAEAYAAASYYCGRKEEAKMAYNTILSMLKSDPDAFSEDDKNKILSNAQFFQ